MSCLWTVVSNDQIYSSSDRSFALLVLKGHYYRLAILPLKLLGAKGLSVRLDHVACLYTSSSLVGVRSH